jgi:AraC-like DNA-binding protein
MAPGTSTAAYDRVIERRRAVALARHFREAEGLSSVQIADRLGRSPATVKAYFYDPTGEKARAVKARYRGLCRACGAFTQPRNGKGDAYAYCKACHPARSCLGAGRWRALPASHRGGAIERSSNTSSP